MPMLLRDDEVETTLVAIDVALEEAGSLLKEDWERRMRALKGSLRSEQAGGESYGGSE